MDAGEPFVFAPSHLSHFAAHPAVSNRKEVGDATSKGGPGYRLHIVAATDVMSRPRRVSTLSPPTRNVLLIA